jgi:hypothetical protein
MAFPAIMNATTTHVRPFSKAKTMFMSDGEALIWLVDSGASYDMTNMRGDFFEYRELTDRVWVKGISAELLA